MNSEDIHTETEALPCAEKLTFSTRADAQAAATVAQYNYGNKLKPYVCRHCDLWHLASVHD